ncbi:YjbH domain-containing protein [Tropicibacter oceani]|uniref:YjbH domain-containing protein n=1 Tax=Tropicibacter oceani TaxID=3058420 RepID=A0ABY8QK13_9RHOB|nr:YjbH domain-containing protein [Tropicibacter oceani]WGW04487.1 YjbH domain-containing protein [Tropicibacter oceani]
MGSILNRLAGLAGLAVVVTTGAAEAQQNSVWDRPSLGFMGVPGLIDMPTAHPMRDADLVFSAAVVGKSNRNTLYFQITPRLSGVFRYAVLKDYDLNTGIGPYDDRFDRSFDFRYHLTEETRNRPAITIGLQDIWGTGVYSGEYITATKTFGQLRATAGVGWGRFGSYNGFTNPLGILSDDMKTRPGRTAVASGQLRTAHWFRGDMGIFGGLQYAVNDRLVLSAEYSSDQYDRETAFVDFDHQSPFNFGINYKTRWGLDAKLAYLHGTTVGVQLSYVFNPKTPGRYPGGIDSAPVPVRARPAGSAAQLGWTTDADRPKAIRASAKTLFDAEGMMLEAMSTEARVATVRFRTGRQSSAAQALGRASRILTQILPDSIERIVLIPVSENGLPAAQVTINRSDLEELEHAPDGAWQSFARAQLSDAFPVDRTLAFPEGTFPKFDWRLGPYVSATYFDPRSPIRLEYGMQATARYEPAPGFVLGGMVRGRLSGSDEDLPVSNSVIRHVRSDAGLYAKDSQIALTNLTAAHYFRPAKDVYGRVSLGYFESMYGGISGEVLWKPVNSRLALGLELNYAQQRDFNQRLGFQSYGVVTGHASAYYEAANGFDYQLDVGRYLAGDWGATVGIDRRFDNGIKIGAFATLTDVPFADFGEGSFDKGIRFEVPLSAITGRSSTQVISRTVRPVQRDGGARLIVDDRLYESVRDYHRPGLQQQWGRFWR